MALKSAYDLFKSLDWIPFSIGLDSDPKTNKKVLVPPKSWQKFTNDDIHFDPEQNALAIKTGEESKLFILDNDNVPQFEDYLQITGYELPETVTAITGSGGRHSYFKMSESLKAIKSNSKVLTHPTTGEKLDMDVRSNGGMIIAPPSSYTRSDGTVATYRWMPGHAPWEMKLAECPDWLIKEISKPGTAKRGKVVRPADDSDVEVTSQDENQTFPVFKSLQDFVFKKFRILPSKLDKIIYYPESQTFNVQTTEKVCIFAAREHSSNHQYLVIREDKLTQRCHSKHETCEGKRSEEEILPEDIVRELHALVKLSDGISNEVIELAKSDAKTMVNDHYDGNEDIEMTVKGDHSIGGMLKKFKNQLKCGKCGKGTIESNTSHQGLYFKCTNCSFRVPKGNVMIPFDAEIYPYLHQYFQIILNVTQNVNTINNNTYNYNGRAPEFEIGWNEFLEDKLQLDSDVVLNELILSSLSGTHMRVADLTFYYLGQGLVYCTIQKKWYHWGPHVWQEVTSEQVHTLVRKSQLTTSLMKAKRIYEQSAVKWKDKKIAQIQKVITQLENNGYQNSIIDQLKIQCSKPRTEFYDKLNKMNSLWAFTNGIYDYEKHEFRQGAPEDFITYTCGFEYDLDKMKDPNMTMEFDDFFHKVFPNSEVGKCFLTVAGSALEGFTGNQVVYFCHGSGGNGKGILGRLLLLVFGDYGGTIQASFLTGRTPDADSPTPALTSIVGKRLVITQEIDPGASLNVPIFKSLTGQDKMQYRPMYGECKDFIPTCQTLFMCNHLPKFPGEDQAMKRRIETFPFISSFKDPEEGPLDPAKHEYPKDKNLQDRLEKWKWVFMQYLIEGNKTFKREGIRIPREMKGLKMKYITGNDIWAMIKDDLFENSTGGGIESTEVRRRVKEWFSENSIQVPKAMDLIANIDMMLVGRTLESNERRFTINHKTYTGYPNWKFKNQVVEDL